MTVPYRRASHGSELIWTLVGEGGNVGCGLTRGFGGCVGVWVVV